VIVACGRHSIPAIPEFSGINHFNGNITHSMKYKSAAHYAGKKVLVLGGSYSGTAIAEDIAKKAAVVYHVFSKPRWVITHSRAHESGVVLPRDLIQTYEQSLKTKSKEERFQFLSTLCAEQMRIPEWRMSPDGEQGVAIAEDYFALARANIIIPRKDRIDYFTSSGVTLKSGEQLSVDEVVCCTGDGYNREFLPAELQSLILYEDIFAPDYPTIAFAGAWIGSRGAVFPLVEIQAEWICGVFSKRLQLPTPEKMRETACAPQERSGAEYFDAIAKTIGVFPNVEKFSPAIQALLMQGANIPARYLLVGPFSNFELAVKLLSEAKNYRDELINSSRQEVEKTPSLRPR
jgi:dimethylaniline monooxygenase (N-oxide forming)